MPIRVAVVGAGPAGIFLAEELLRGPHPVEIELFERLPLPFGLVRYGVAPDHPHTRRITSLLERTLKHASVTLHTGVDIGRDLSIDELRARFHAVVIATGAEEDRRLGIPGESLPNVIPSLHFAGWLNGHPRYRDLPIRLDAETAVIIGNGNVALDVARMLCRTPDELNALEMPPLVRDALSQHRIRRIHIIGRRGPVQASFGDKELAELGELPGIAFLIDPIVQNLSAVDQLELASPDAERQREVIRILRNYAERPRPPSARIEIAFNFLRRPIAFNGVERVCETAVEVCRLEGEPFNQRAVPTGAIEKMECGLVVVSIGHRGRAIPGLPFDEAAGVIPTADHRVMPGVYAVGWIKRGARGLIGHNRRDAMETARALLADFARFGDRSEFLKKR